MMLKLNYPICIFENVGVVPTLNRVAFAIEIPIFQVLTRKMERNHWTEQAVVALMLITLLLSQRKMA